MKAVSDFVLIIGIVITVLVLLSLLSAKRKAANRYILITFFASTLLVNIHAYSSLHDIHVLFSLTFLFDFMFVWLLGPLLLLYIKTLFTTEPVTSKANVLHFSPIMLLIIGLAIPLTLTEMIDGFAPSYLGYLEENQIVIVMLRNIYCIIYLVYSLKRFSVHRQQYKSIHSNFSERDFGWIKKLLAFSLIFISIDFLFTSYDAIIFPLAFHQGFLLMSFIIFFTIYLAYYGINQSRILLPDFLTHKPQERDSKMNKAVKFSQEEVESLKVRIDQQLINEKYYLDENLTLTKLASEFGLSDKHFSEFLNQYLGVSFYDYINSYRLAEVKRNLVSPDFAHYTVLGIATESGFNSKATFNRIFRKETGMTPSEYRKLNTKP